MHIALLAPLRFPIREPYAGGLEAHTHSLARRLRELGHEVTLIAHPASDPSFKIIPFQAPESAAFWPSLVAYRRAVQAIAAGSFDVVQDNSVHWAPPALSRGLPVPMITTLHTPPYRTHRWSAPLCRRSPRLTYVSISDFLAQQWSHLDRRPVTIHNGIALGHFPFAPAAAPNTAIWYGRITPNKGTHHAIEAAQIANFTITLAGPIEDKTYFKERVRPLLSHGVRYVGHVNQTRLAELIGRAAVGLVTPHWEEPFGLVCVELLACGTPVAAFNSGAIGEILTDNVAATVPKGDVRALAQVLSEVARKPRPACRARAEDFSTERMVSAYTDMYKRVTT